jgi:hypothetical protein
LSPREWTELNEIIGTDERKIINQIMNSDGPGLKRVLAKSKDLDLTQIKD